MKWGSFNSKISGKIQILSLHHLTLFENLIDIFQHQKIFSPRIVYVLKQQLKGTYLDEKLLPSQYDKFPGVFCSVFTVYDKRDKMKNCLDCIWDRQYYDTMLKYHNLGCQNVNECVKSMAHRIRDAKRCDKLIKQRNLQKLTIYPFSTRFRLN